jgi:hypothetical protein
MVRSQTVRRVDDGVETNIGLFSFEAAGHEFGLDLPRDRSRYSSAGFAPSGRKPADVQQLKIVKSRHKRPQRRVLAARNSAQ